MGAIVDKETRTRTIKEWAELSGINPDTARRIVARKSGTTAGQKTMLTPDQWEAWKPGHNPDKTRTATKEKTISSIAPTGEKRAMKKEASPAPVVHEAILEMPSFSSIRSACLDMLLIGIAAGHAILIWYDCFTLWGTPGLIGGGLAFGIVLATIMLATDPTKNVTSQYALLFALVVDAGAFWVHYPVFSEYDAPEGVTVALCVFLCAMSWGALFLYRHQKNN